MKNTIVGVDLAKDVIPVCIYTNKKVRSNIEMTPPEFIEFLANYTSLTIVFEACGTSNYWKQKAISLGHDARLISAKLVSVVRQNQKTDKNDALAIIQAALLPDVTFISGKSIEQQQLQSIMRLRELCVKQKTAAGNQLTSLLLEFNIKVSSRNSGLKGAVKSTLEDAENGTTICFVTGQDHREIISAINASNNIKVDISNNRGSLTSWIIGLNGVRELIERCREVK